MLTLLGQTGLTIVAVLAAGIVCGSPSLSRYTLQFLGVSIVLFLLINRVVRRRQISFATGSKRNNLASTLEVAVISFALLLAIGSTGGYASWLLPLYLIYFILLNFVCPLLPTLVSFVATLVLFYLTTPVFTQAQYGSLLSLLVFVPIAVGLQHVYAKFLLERQNARLEREKVAYYNLYAEKQQAELLKRDTLARPTSDLADYLRELIPQIDELQKMSRHPENQLVLSSSLTKIGLSARQALKKHEQAHTEKAPETESKS